MRTNGSWDRVAIHAAAWGLLTAVCLCGCPSTRIPAQPGDTIDDFPAWSPAGSLIAYTHYAQELQDAVARGNQQIFLYNLRTGDTAYVGPGWLPTWSNNGDTLGFVVSGRLHAHVLSSGKTFRISDVAPCYWPAWSPTGGRIAFDTSHQDPRGSNVVWTMLSDGSDLTDISTHGVGEWRGSAWTAEGDSILHFRYLAGVAGPELFIMAADGSGGRRLTFNGAEDYRPDCSRDGRFIAWTQVEFGGGHGILTMDRQTGTIRQLFRGASEPSWNPSGDSLAFAFWDPTTNRKTLWVGDAQRVSMRPLTR